jgi:monothiol glutaredoxin
MSDAQERIKQTVENNDVVLFMKGSPEFPQCGFSGRAVQVLQACGARFESVDVLADPEVREGIKQYSNWPTIPQLYVKGEFVGGSDIMLEMYQNGELQKKLEEVPA